MFRLMLAAGALAILIGLGFICPQIANLRMRGNLITPEVALMIGGTVLVCAGAAVILGILCGLRVARR